MNKIKEFFDFLAWFVTCWSDEIYKNYRNATK